jgi:Arc/MetJ-type ribon-helix-helix transcriptional regulator
MSRRKPLTVTLSPRAAAMLEAMVSDGTFPDVAHAVEGVVDEWAARHDDDPAFVAALRRLCAEADASGPPAPAALAFDRVRSQLAARMKDPSARV